MACIIFLGASCPVRGAATPLQASQLSQAPAAPPSVRSLAESHERIGVQLARQGRPSEAAEQFLQALWIDPQFAGAYYNLGLVRLNWGDLEAAIQSFRQALRINPSDLPARLHLASALTQLARDHPASLTEAITACRQAIKLDARQPEAHFDLGVLEAEKMEFQDAAAEYEETLRLQPAYPDATLNLAIALYHLAQFDRAYTLFQKAVVRHPRSAAAHRYLGLLLLKKQGELGLAAGELQTAARLDPQNLQIHYALAEAFSRLGRAKQATAELGIVERLQRQLNQSEQARFHAQRAESLVRAGKIEQANEEYQRSLQLREDPAVACSFASALLWQGDTARALEVMHGAIAADPKSAWSYYYLGVTLARRHELRPARQALQSALKLKPDFPEAELYVGLTYAGEGRFQDAEHYMRLSAQARPDSAPALYYLGIVLQRLGKHTEGAAEIEAAHRLDPQFKPQ